MKKLRLLLLPLAAVLEITMLIACWVAAPIAPRAAGRMVVWAEQCLPSFRWYTGK